MSQHLLQQLDIRNLQGTSADKKCSEKGKAVPPSKIIKEQNSKDTQSIRISLPRILIYRLALLQLLPGQSKSRNEIIRSALEDYMKKPEIAKALDQISKSIK